MSNLAGTSSAGHSDGSLGSESFSFVAGISSSPDGSKLAVTDYYCHTICISDTATGAISTLAGGLDPSDGNVCDAVNSTGSDARFRTPYYVSWSPDGKLIAIVEEYNKAIRMITVETREVITVAGAGTTGSNGGRGYVDGSHSDVRFNMTSAVSFSPNSSQILVTDTYNSVIHKIVVATGETTTLAGNGTNGNSVGPGFKPSLTLIHRLELFGTILI